MFVICLPRKMHRVEPAAFPKPFVRLAWSNLAAQIAEQIALAAIPIVAVTAFNAGPGETGWLQTAYTLPFLLLAVPVGIVADRFSRIPLMRCGEIIRAASLLSISALMTIGTLNLPTLAALALLAASGTAVYWIVTPAVVPTLVAKTELSVANTRMELARTAAFAAGPVLAGLLVQFVGGPPTFAVAALGSFAAFALLCTVREPMGARMPTPPAVGGFGEGLRFVFASRLLRPIFHTQLLFNGAFFIVQAVYVPYAMSGLGLSSSVIGLTIGCYGLGMVLGALAAPRIANSLALGTVVAIGPLCGVLASALLLVTTWLPSGWLAALSYFLFGVGPILWIISTTTLRQTITPAGILGRVSAVHILAYGARPVGSLLAALLGSLHGATACFVIASAAFAWQALIILRSPVMQLRTLADASLRQ